jgi:predicted DsbA family dithiol-disulfide isomerase
MSVPLSPSHFYVALIILVATPRAMAADGVTVTDLLSGEDPILATIDGEPLLFSDIGAEADLNRALITFDDDVRTRLEDRVSEALATREASAIGMTADEWWAIELQARVLPVTEAEARTYFEENPPRGGGSNFEDMRDRVIVYMERQREAEARAMIASELRERYTVEILFEPFRVDVTVDDDPARGPEHAPITIVMFFDFQCGYCGKARQTLDEIQQRYPDQVRLVARDFPLPKHTNAVRMASAAACAREQGQYWPYFDALFDNPRGTTDRELAERATEMGLNVSSFRSCLEEDHHAEETELDHQAGERVGVTGTPMFYVNGRPLAGAQPISSFVELIEDELRRQR